MVRIVNCCYTNLKQQNSANEQLSEDITNEITVGTSPLLLLSAIDLTRRIIKIFTIQYSNSLTQLWVRHGTTVTVNNSGVALPEKRLYVDSSQASRPLSVICNTGTALIRFTVVNKL